MSLYSTSFVVFNLPKMRFQIRFPPCLFCIARVMSEAATNIVGAVRIPGKSSRQNRLVGRCFPGDNPSFDDNAFAAGFTRPACID
jgi:hypothetical protein